MSPSRPDSAPALMLARKGNLAVVHIPDRRFPAVAIQGDTFHTLVAQGEEALAALQTGGVDSAIVSEVAELVQRLEAVRAYYEETLAEFGVACPYVR